MPPPGTLIEGKYEILGKISEGGMGAIYKVRHKLLDEVRVIKVMRPEMVADEELKRRFTEEAKTATRLKHPNIGTILDFALDDDGTAYLVMEFIEGVSLAQLLVNGPPGVPASIEIAHQSLLALGYLHRKNIVHRDIAPDNLMLSQDEEGRPQIKLIDLGIAKATDSEMRMTSTGVFLGKLKYASPELFGALTPGEKLDGRSDLYSLGVVLYELLTGTRPMVGETPAELLRAHLFAPPRPFEETDPHNLVPADVRAIVLKALQKKREDRFASAEDFDREILSLRTRGTAPGDLDATVALLTRARRESRNSQGITVTPSAQGRLDRQFVSQPTPHPVRPTTNGPPMTTELTKTQLDPQTAARPVRPAPSAGEPSRARPNRIWFAGGFAVAILAIAGVLVMLGRRPAEKAPKTALPTPAAATAIPIPSPIEVEPTRPEPTAAPATAPTVPRLPTAVAEPIVNRAAAQQARRYAATGRTNAEKAGAVEKAPDPYREGQKAFSEGENLLARRQFDRAQAAYERSAERFAAAESLITQLSVRRAAAATAVPPPPTAIAEPTRHATAVAVVPPTPPAAETPRPTVTEPEKIREAIHRYERAQSELDADAYARVFPAVDKTRIRAAFADLRSQSVEVSVKRIEIGPGGSSAEVSATEIRTFAPRTGSEQRISGNRVFHFEKRGETWVIVGLGS